MEAAELLGGSIDPLTESLSQHQKADFAGKYHDAVLEALRKDTGAKQSTGVKTFWLVAIWLGVVILTLWMNATGCFFFYPNWSFWMSDTVLITLITTTTANVAIFLLSVIKHLFPNNGDKKAP